MTVPSPDPLPDWTVDPATEPGLARVYCSDCERHSRPVRVPTDAEKRAAFPVPLYPKPPKGWGRGCPRCFPEDRHA